MFVWCTTLTYHLTVTMFRERTEFPFSEANILMMFGTDVCNLEYQRSHKTWAGESLFFLFFLCLVGMLMTLALAQGTICA